MTQPYLNYELVGDSFDIWMEYISMLSKEDIQSNLDTLNYMQLAVPLSPKNSKLMLDILENTPVFQSFILKGYVFRLCIDHGLILLHSNHASFKGIDNRGNLVTFSSNHYTQGLCPVITESREKAPIYTMGSLSTVTFSYPRTRTCSLFLQKLE